MGFIRNIFGGKKAEPVPEKPKFEIICPYCMTKNITNEKLTECKKCTQRFPSLYRTEVYESQQFPPFFLQIAGHSQTGKSIWLMVLTHILMKMDKLWPNYFHQSATESTDNFISDVRHFLGDGKVPNSTPMGVREAYMLLLNQMGTWPSRSLVIRDCSGEAFQPREFSLVAMPYFLHVPTTLLFFSLNDMDKSRATMDTLLTNYQNTLIENNIILKQERRNIVVVLSKADEIEDLPKHLLDYLRNDPLWTDLSSKGIPRPLNGERMMEYMDILSRVSDATIDWLRYRGDVGVNGFLNIAQRNNIRVSFSLVSSLGTQPNASGVVEAFNPWRVLDPFLWAMEFEKTRTPGT